MTRHAAIFDLLVQQLARVGRAGTKLLLRSDYTVVLADADGGWEGPMPRAFATLVVCDDGAGAHGAFWARFA